MDARRLLLPLVVLAVVAGRAAAQTGHPCPPVYAPAPRVRVIVPPPEVVFRPCSKPAGCAPAAPTDSGTISFNMNYAMPMGAQMSLFGQGLGAGGAAGGIDPQLLRLLLAQAGGNGVANDSPEAILRRLSAAVEDMRAQLAGVRQMRSDIDLLLVIVRNLQEESKKGKAGGRPNGE